MKNTRKKMLLSSIAMLLVALIALGSATFAWYFSNATVTASTNTFKAAADTGLVIRHHNSGADSTWGSTVTTLESAPAGGLSPASITYANTLSTTRGGTATSTAYNVSTMKADTLSAATIENGGSFLVDEFYVASANDTVQTATLTVKGGTTTSGGYLNFAIYVDGSLKKVLTNDNAFDATTGFGKLKNGTGTGVEVDTSNYTTSVGKFTGNDAVDASVSCTSKTSGGAHVQIVAFADGFNDNCKSSTISDAVLNLTYEVSVNA